MAKYIFGILACAFLALGFTHISNKELQGFQKETGVPAIDMSYNEGANCCISSAGFDKSCKETHSLLTDGTYGSKVSDCIFDNLSFPRSIVPFKNLVQYYQYCNSTDIELVEYDASGETSEPYLL